MPPKNKKPSPERQAQLIEELKRDREARENSYRGRALKLFPHLCARCAREFSGKRLKELTVHHKDHNHDNNPNDGSNWELLCLYCHDNEHDKERLGGFYNGSADNKQKLPPSDFKPFAGLDSLLRIETKDDCEQ